jgi:ATP phosphoribosyltransferase
MRRIMTRPITFAIPKGRILDEALPLLARAGIEPEAEFHKKESRALKFATNVEGLSIIRVRAFDVIAEFGYSELYAPVDLAIGACRLSVAEPQDAPPEELARASHVRVATKYPHLTRDYYERQGIQAECVKLNGAMELAPSLGLSRRIVDLVSSGATLKANGLVETATIMQISSRLVVNRAAMKMRAAELVPMVERFREAVGAQDAA